MHSPLHSLRTSLYPYAQLARIDKPAGVLAIYPPYLLGALVYAVQSDNPKYPVSISTNTLLILSSFILRSAGCAWNDLIDRDVDRLVARSKKRPIASGAISPRAGGVFASSLILAWLAIVWVTNRKAIASAVSNVPLVLLYPFAKRFTDFPQLVLGVTLSWGVFTGYLMADQGVYFSRADQGSRWGWSDSYEVYVGLGWLAAAWIVFTLFYDTIYAYQDIEDDCKSGVRSTAVKFGDGGKWILVLTAFCQALHMCLAGVYLGWSELYLAVCGVTAVFQLYIVWRVDLDNPQSCGLWFRRSLLIVSALMAISVAWAKVDVGQALTMPLC